MPSFDKSKLLSQSAQTPWTVAPLGLPGAIGPIIQNSKVRRIWIIQAQSTPLDDHLIIYAGDVAMPNRRLLASIPCLANTTVILPLPAYVESPLFIVRPQTQFTPTQENQIYSVTLLGAQKIVWSFNYYDLRG